ncbi:putative programmed cell death protein [Neospora caninum Liverpool]|uniref:Programmed cell death protein, putative n=1 Tax=Neospora caninum (strain Liverpool) TaxID=572307 RepID=F0V7G3_NEOCL|nr:putative programmed cell death protein [Neospora caninum Liverpool]CBZ49654.1 putative programmed cell death protein [Neospora caninum Liverpool]CEL64238.1 TPA: programmed cell death protein, putative [Neospora caninum Liverpool]|eukprot:XP_003879689.1 putative programmed cell death protein [Neospora caninum Liverpool]
MPRVNPLYPSFPLAEVPSELFWASWREATQRSRSLSSVSVASSMGERTHLGNQAGESVSRSPLDPEKKQRATSRVGDDSARAGRKGEKEALVCALQKIQEEERRLRGTCCPVCGLPSGNEEGKETSEKTSGERDAQQPEDANCMRRKLVRLLLLRSQEATSAFQEACNESDSSRVIDVDEEEAILEEIKQQAEQGVYRLHRRCRIFASHWSRGLCCALPEFELEVGEEEEGEDADEGAGPSYEHEKELLRKYEEEARTDPEALLDESEQEAFESIHEEHSSLDPQLLRFLKRCSSCAANRGQVLRYALGGRPLWPFTPGQMEGEPPACEKCGAKRQFEFQVLPQFLFEMKRCAGVKLESKVHWTGDADPHKNREASKAKEEPTAKREAREAAAESSVGGPAQAKGEAAGKSKAASTTQAAEVEEQETGGASRMEAAQAASERLHFALLCMYTCSAHCRGKPERTRSESDEGKKGEGNQTELREAAYPYIKEFVYVQPDPFFVKRASEKEQKSG